MTEKIMMFLRDEDGMTSVEYAVAGALISVALIGTFSLLGDQVAAAINAVTRAFD